MRESPLWLWMLVPMFLGIFLLPNFISGLRENSWNSTTPIETADQVRMVTWNGLRWAEVGDAEAIPTAHLRLVGTSQEGLPVYVRAPNGGGGGPSAAGRLYLKLADGRYQPLVSRATTP